MNYNNFNKFHLGILSLCFIIFGCQSKSTETVENKKNDNNYEQYITSYDKIPSNTEGGIIKKAITQAGGWDKWISKKAMSFVKVTTTYDSTGAIKKVSKSLNEYNLFPSFQAKITWEDNGKKYIIINNGQQVWKLEDGKLMTDEKNKTSAWNSSFGTHYVISMPFKLADPGAIPKFEGIIILPNGRKVNAIKVTYKEGAGSSALFHKWWYYFDPQTSEMVANFIDYGKGYTYTVYDAFIEVDGIKINKARQSFKSDSTKTKILLESKYENEDIQFKDAFPPSYFVLPK